jgi:4-hydroxybenzoate polyprenyltransferase
MTALAARLGLYARLVRLDKPIGIYLLLWPTLDALWIAAGGWPGFARVLIFCAGTALTRSAGCAINDFADRGLDSHVARTSGRVLAQGLIAPREALWVGAALALAAALTLPFMRRAVLPYAFAAVAISVAYPYFKRFFPVPQAWLGVAFSFGSPMAFTEVTGAVGPVGWGLFAANLFWVMAYDTEYAMVDRPDDLRVGIRSSAIFFGRADVVAIAVCYAAYLGLLAWVGVAAGLGAGFATGWLAAAALALRHLWWIRGRDPQQCFRAFRDNHWLGLCIFAGIVLEDALR